MKRSSPAKQTSGEENSDIETLLSALTYLTPQELALVREAYELANLAHKGQKRVSGEPYITHPIEVAKILCQMHMDVQSIMGALLHDVLEDTGVSKEDLIRTFGQEVADLVDGVSKLDQIKAQTRLEAQAENLRKMMLAMTKDIRVILIKLADRLHNIRTLSILSPEKKKRIARETLELYAPIANRLGMNSFRIEYEDIGFSHLYPMRYKVLRDSVLKARGNRREIVQGVEQTLKNRLEQEHLSSFQVMGREKHLYSLYKKMKNKDLSLSEIMDIYAIRVIVDSVDTCYRVLGIAHNLFKPIHGRFKDYIAVPKANGYQSIHSAVLGPFGIPIEIQIRTQDMHEIAEKGIAAHWLYKSPEKAINAVDRHTREWLKGILEIQENTRNSTEFIEHVKIDLYPDEVYVFTKTGDILSLPNGSSVVDFAYAVHTDVGNSCIACKIDRRLMPLSTRLKNGQTIEIVTASGAHPNPAWLSFVTTGKARSNIRNWLKSQQSDQARDLGKRLLQKALRGLSMELDEIAYERFQGILSQHKLNTIDELFETIGLGNLAAPLIARRLVSDYPEDQHAMVQPLAICGTEGMVVSYAKCCYPIPGDEIIGFLSSGRGVVIHRDKCKNVDKALKNPEKHLYVQWAQDIDREFEVGLEVEVINARGILATLANALVEKDANIQNVYIDERDQSHNIITFLLMVKDRAHLNHVIKRLKEMPVVTQIKRCQ